MSLSQLKSYLYGRYGARGTGRLKIKAENHEEVRKAKRKAARKARKINRGRQNQVKKFVYG